MNKKLGGKNAAILAKLQLGGAGMPMPGHSRARRVRSIRVHVLTARGDAAAGGFVYVVAMVSADVGHKARTDHRRSLRLACAPAQTFP